MYRMATAKKATVKRAKAMSATKFPVYSASTEEVQSDWEDRENCLRN
jgi:hypothetical protein